MRSAAEARRLLAACLLACASTGAAHAADWNGYVSLSSDYMFRGVSLLDSGPGLQASIEGRFDDRFVVGAWAANIDHQWYENSVRTDAEVNLYGGFDFGCGERCRARIIVTDYLFAGGRNAWQEATLSVAFAGRVGASFSYSPHGVGPAGDSTRTVEGWVVQPISRELSISLDAGKVWLGSFGYWYARAGISRKVDRWVFDLSHYWSDPTYRIYGFDDRSRRFVVSVSTAF
jgi:uncharacterized protein (TIGR02001 family)